MPAFLSDDDLITLKEIIHDFKTRPRNIVHRASVVAANENAPSVYIALPETEDGIPPISRSGSGTGTYGGPSQGDVPGSAYCQTYTIIAGTLYRTTMAPVKVYNLTLNRVPQEFISIQRTAYGNWVFCGLLASSRDDCKGIPGVDLETLPVDTSPSSVLGVSSDGCLVRIGVTRCEESDGEGSETGTSSETGTGE